MKTKNGISLTQTRPVLVRVGPAEVRPDRARVQGEHREALGAQPPRELDGEEDERGLGLAVRAPHVVRLAVLYTPIRDRI